MSADHMTLSRDLEYRLGVPPLIRLNGKEALDNDWPRGPWDDPDLWRKRLEHHQDNVGAVTGCRPDRTGTGLLVADYDFYKPEGLISYEVAQDLGWVLDTPTVQTPSGGEHRLMSYDPTRWIVRSKALKGKPIPGTDDKFPGGFEVKAEGGYIAWYSTWVDGLSRDEVPIAPAPESLLELIGIRIDPETGNPVGGVQGPWSTYDPEAVHPDTAYATKLLLDHFGAHDPIVVRSGPEPHVEVKRPGKTTGTRSATVGWLKPGLVKVFTDGWDPFDQNQVIDLGELERLAGIERPPQVKVPRLLPDGFRAWRPEDGVVNAPVLGAAAFHGPIGDYLELTDGQTEAHPAAIGAHLLASVATLIGGNARYAAGSIRHRSNVFLAVTGNSSTGAKGVAEAEANRLIEVVSPAFQSRHTVSGIGSGEMLIWEVRDPDPNNTDDDGTPDPGGVKERIAQNAELSALFKVANREQSILSDQLRLAFDGAPMRHSTKGGGIVTATNHHINIVGSITPGELVKVMDDVSRVNGFGNRFVYLWSEMADLLPFGGDLDQHQVDAIGDTISNRLGDLRIRSGLLGFTDYGIADDARDTWATFYRRARTGIGEGFTAEMTGRSVAHAARIALIYAVLDGADRIGTDHIAAAEAWVDYGAATVEKVFGGGVSGLAGMLLAAIRDAGPDGMTLTQQSEVFSRNRSAAELDQARTTLEARHLIHTTAASSSTGRPTRRSVAIWAEGGATNPRKKRINPEGDSSFNSSVRNATLRGEP
jgi:hypothetical protein